MRPSMLLLTVALAAALAAPPVAATGQPALSKRLVPGSRVGGVVEVRDSGTTVTRTFPGLAALGTSPSLTAVAAAWRSELRWMTAQEAGVEQGDSEEAETYGWVDPVGDLDGDRRRDVVAAHTQGETLTFQGRTGRSGKVLWRHTEPGAFGHAMAATLGPDHERGVLLLSVALDVTEDDNGATLTSTTTVSALTAGGTLLWRRTFNGSGTMNEMGIVMQGVAFPAGVGRLNEDRATDVLIASTDVAAAAVAGAERLQLLVLDGATGETTMTTESPNAGGFSSAGLVGDLDGDGLDDVVTAGTAPGGVAVTAYRGADGRPLWNRAVEAEFVYAIADGGDLDADGAADLLLGSFDSESFHGTVHVLSGAGGTPLWSATADIAVAAGDLDGDGSDDVVLQQLIDGFGSSPSETPRVGVRYLGRRGDGSKLFARTHALRMREGSSMTSMALYGEVGDASGDRRPDLAHEIEHYSFDKRGGRFERGVVRSSDGEKTLRGRIGYPLFAKVDRRGHDFAVAANRKGALWVRVRDGRTGKPLWRRSLPPRADYPAVTAADVTGDRRAEVFVTVSGGRMPRTYALDARTGSVRWKR